MEDRECKGGQSIAWNSGARIQEILLIPIDLQYHKSISDIETRRHVPIHPRVSTRKRLTLCLIAIQIVVALPISRLNKIMRFHEV